MDALYVATWNVLAASYLRLEYYPHLTAAPDHQQRRAQIRSRMMRLAASGVEVVALQEVEPDVAGDVADTLAGWTIEYIRRPGRNEGSLIASARRPSASILHEFCNDRVATTLLIDGTAVTSTHLTWSDTPDPTPHPAAAEARELAAQLEAYPRSVIVGDLNDTPGGPVLATFAQLGWRPDSWTGTTAITNGTRPAHIDHLLGRGAAISGTHATVAADRALPDAAFPSDHVPVAATITI